MQCLGVHGHEGGTGWGGGGGGGVREICLWGWELYQTLSAEDRNPEERFSCNAIHLELIRHKAINLLFNSRLYLCQFM